MAETLKEPGTDGGPSTSGHALTYAPVVKDGLAEATARLPGSTKLLFVTSEMGDFIKAGGLGEVSMALPRQLRSLCDVRVLLPGFRQVRSASPAMDIVRAMPRTAGLPPWSLGRFRTADGLTIYAVLCDELYDREGSPYGPHSGGDFPDNDIRFARLSLAAAEIAAGEADPNWKPDVVHVNDWPSALAPGYMRWKGLATPSILTIHNLAYQGLYQPSRMGALGIPDLAFSVNGAEFHGKISFLKGGIYYSSHVTTVSETYAREITTAEHGCGLDGLLRLRMDEGRLTGIVNGIDDSWTSPLADATRGIRQWKRRSAADIRKAFELPPSRGPLFSIISRLVHQKGIDLSIEAAKPSSAMAASSSSPAAASRGWRTRSSASPAATRRPSRHGSASTMRSATHLCRQRLPADALALRALRAQPDVCPALRRPAHRLSHRRAGGHDRGRALRLPVLVADRRGPGFGRHAGLRRLPFESRLPADAPARHGQALRLGRPHQPLC